MSRRPRIARWLSIIRAALLVIAGISFLILAFFAICDRLHSMGSRY